MRPYPIALCLLLALAACGGQRQSGVQPASRASAQAPALSAALVNVGYDDIVQKMYIAYFGRPADSGGLAYFKEQFAAAGAPTTIAALAQAYGSNAAVKTLIDGFANSAESAALYPGDNRSFILAIYQNLFNRVTDPAGLSYWGGLLDAGAITRASAVIAIMSGSQGTDTRIIENKSAVAANFTGALTTSEKVAAYSGLVANVSVRAMLATVSDTSSVASFQAAITVTLSDLLLNGSAGNRADLGERIFNDTNLSEPRGTACVQCHLPSQGFSSPNGSMIGVALGSMPGSLGLRKPMNNSYAGLVPPFAIITEFGVTIASGGLFWDGRAETPALQALGPFLNPLEMNNSSRKAVVDKIAASSYAALFKQTFGATIFDNPDLAYTQIGVAIEAFERTKLQPFTSKFDAMTRGKATFTVSEARGLAMFEYESKGNCSACHSIDSISDNPRDSLFTDFSYRNTGVPRNVLIPRNADKNFFDLGLCGPERAPPALPATVDPSVKIADFCGKFRVPTLRNVAERPAFMHNGVFTDLHDVVRFYSNRNVGTVSDDLPAQYQRNTERSVAPFNRPAHAGPAMSESEIGDVVAFLKTLSDGYVPP